MIEIRTPMGQVEILRLKNKELFETLIMDNKLNNFRSASRQKESLMVTSELEEGIVYIAKHEQKIIGYILINPPSQQSRWSKHPRLLELAAVEVSPGWKKTGIASSLLQECFNNTPEIEEYIIIATEFYWHWDDLSTSGLNIWQYKKMLKKLFSCIGFKKRNTDDPDILEHPANMLLVRFGKNITKNHINIFEDLTYQDSILM
ncbi:MAG: GNAT family N-acetyltransferase [Clostridiales bacterium]|nr:GNAT family N-acetyltransferase [Clostridiales bacterium]